MPSHVSITRHYRKDTKKQREAAEMRAQGVSLRNIAKSLNTSKSTVERWLDDSDK
ncbi:MAG: helix-turn-helix domain-containing protein, partial [Acidobacteria bacterium]|nr:helix-turn-helix domain-containing protein [Acidobacteriota bacterium]